MHVYINDYFKIIRAGLFYYFNDCKVCNIGNNYCIADQLPLPNCHNTVSVLSSEAQVIFFKFSHNLSGVSCLLHEPETPSSLRYDSCSVQTNRSLPCVYMNSSDLLVSNMAHSFLHGAPHRVAQTVEIDGMG